MHHSLGKLSSSILFIHSTGIYWISTELAGTVLGASDTAVNKTNEFFKWSWHYGGVNNRQIRSMLGWGKCYIKIKPSKRGTGVMEWWVEYCLYREGHSARWCLSQEGLERGKKEQMPWSQSVFGVFQEQRRRLARLGLGAADISQQKGVWKARLGEPAGT